MKRAMRQGTTDTPRTEARKGVLVRLPEALHEDLADRAAEQRRSVNAHVVWLIEQDLKEAA